MLDIRNYSTVYIGSPRFNTGGPRSLHQLASILSRYHSHVFIVYYQGQEILKNIKKPLFNLPGIQYTDHIEDRAENLLIVPENNTRFLSNYSSMAKAVWWLSLDLYFVQSIGGKAAHLVKINHRPAYWNLLYRIAIWKDHPSGLFEKSLFTDRELKNTWHLYNCQYVKDYLLSKGVPEERMKYLCGPLEDKFLRLNPEDILPFKKNTVTYNPAKTDPHYFEQIIQAVQKKRNDISFIPIQNMNREEVFDTLKKCKVYVDLGYFPGPERMPREAASLYCNLITSRTGSASNDIDVPIPSANKHALTKENIPLIADQIIEMIDHYSNHIHECDIYRNAIWHQIEGFEDMVREALLNQTE